MSKRFSFLNWTTVLYLLACRLGLRCTDIKNLTMDNFHWEDKKLLFVQSKTRKTLSLPLTTEVGWSVIDYLKYGRPNVESRCVFVRHLAPFLPFSELGGGTYETDWVCQVPYFVFDNLPVAIHFFSVMHRVRSIRDLLFPKGHIHPDQKGRKNVSGTPDAWSGKASSWTA